MVIRPAAPDDAVELTALAHRAKARWGYPAEWLAAWQDDLTITAAYIQEHLVFAARLGERLVGVCAAEDRGASWSLEHVWVDPEHQGMGIGQALVRRTLGAIRDARPGVVTIASDPHAAGFYQRLGARPAGAMAAPMPGAPQRTLPLFELGP